MENKIVVKEIEFLENYEGYEGYEVVKSFEGNPKAQPVLFSDGTIGVVNKDGE